MFSLTLSENIRGALTTALIIYFAAISIVSVVICCIDKINAKKHKARVPESDLLLFSALGGSVFMLITMLIIRHKTKKPKFMVGIPAIIVLQALVAVLILF